jgi:hypothetical protein
MNIAGRVLPLKWVLITLMALAFAVRLGGIVALTGLDTPPAVSSDEFEYDTYAWNLVQGRGYRGPSPDVPDANHLTAYRPPTTSLYYAAIYALVGHRYAAAHLANCLLAALTVLLVFAIGARCFGRRAGMLAAAAYAFYPFAIFYNLTLLSETLAAFLLALFAWTAMRLGDGVRPAWAAASGLALFAVPMLIPWWALVRPRSAGGDWRRVGLVVGIAVLLVSCWGIRNRAVMGSFIPFSTLGGSLLLMSNNRMVVEDPSMFGYSVWDTTIPEYAAALRAPQDEVKRDAVAKQLATRWIVSNPDKWFYLVQGKLLRLWLPKFYGKQNRLLTLAFSVYYGVVLAVFLVAVVPVTQRLIRERHPGLVVHLLLISAVLTALIFQGQHRYRVPTDGFLMMIAAGGVVALWDRLRTAGSSALMRDFAAGIARRKLAITLAPIVAAALLVCWSADQGHVARYRDAVCESRIKAVGEAITRFSADKGKLPASVAELVPAYLPNVGALHCPLDPVTFDDYHKIPSAEVSKAKDLISYRMTSGPGGAWTVSERARHFQISNQISGSAGVIASVK